MTDKRIRKKFEISSYLFIFLFQYGFAQEEFTNPPSNFQVIPAGSFVIPMDTFYQSIGQAPFNLKAYGLINQFLQNGIPVKWAIRSGKKKEEVDFTAMAESISPTGAALASIDFRGGPFIVPDTVLPCGLSTSQIILLFKDNVAVYKLYKTTVVDIRYTLTHRPKIAVFNNGGNQLIHTKILNAAGISDYDVMDAADIADLINCYTFVSEPHANSNQVSASVISGIKKFVMNGGNFLAQCDAIDAYENRGFFLTTAGITVVNTTVTHQYLNADLCFSQINGTVVENQGGSIHNWTLKSGSAWIPGAYLVVADNNMDTVIAMGGHLIDPLLPGGNVYYLGGHDYSQGVGNATQPGNIKYINAFRLYLNAIFVPSRNSNGSYANAGPSATVGCNDSIVLGCNPTGPLDATFLWTPSSGLSCTTCANPKAHPAVSTIYKVEVTNGCKAFDTVKILVNPQYLAEYSNTIICQGKSTSFNDQSIGATFRQWDFGDPLSGQTNYSDLPNPTHTFTSAGSFQVKLIAGIRPACTDTLVKPVVVNPAPVPHIDPVTKGCGPLEVVFRDASSVSKGSVNKWLWNFGDEVYSSNTNASDLQNPTHTYKNPGMYSIKLQVTTDLGCDSTAVLNNWVEVYASPAINLAPDQKICTENGTTLFLDAGKGFKYLWQPGGDTGNVILVKEPGTYTVKATNQYGCFNVSSTEVMEVCPPRLFISNSFSPNGDNKNERYNVYGAHFTNFHMFIFNRWGEIIFESKDKNTVWDGMYREVPMPIGVYPWIITYTGDSEDYYGPYKMEGSVTIVR